MAAPEIRLSIGLDLEFFRGQMRKAVNIAQSEFTAQLAVKIDRNKLNTELNNLQKAIKRRGYYIEIKGNLEKAPDKIASLKKALSDLEGTKIDLGIGGITSIGRDEARKIRTALRRSILENGGKILVPTSIAAAITEDDVAAFQAIVKRKLSGIKASLSVAAGINSEDIATFKEATQTKLPGIKVPVSILPKISAEDIATFKEATQTKLSGIKVPVSILPKISAEDITAFKEAVKNKLSGIKVKVEVEAQVSGAGAGAATVPGEKKRPAGYEAALQSIGNLQVEQLRKRAFSSLGEESRTAQQVSTWLTTIVDQGLKGKAKASQLTAVREFLAEGLATAAGKNIEARMQPIQGRDPDRRGAFPYVAKTGPIESKILFAEAIALAAKIDAQLAEQARLLQEQARLLQEQTRRQAQYLARQNELLRNAATRFLPSAKEQIGGRSAQSQVVGNFYDRIRKTEKVFAQNFSANSYLPKASTLLASSMDNAATQLKALPATRIAGALPSSEMRLAPRRELYRDILSRGSIPTSNARPWQKPSAAGPMALPPARIAGLLEPADVQNQRKFKKAIEVAATVDAVNAAKHREQLKVNAENQVRAKEAAKRDLRNMFTGLPPIQAPSIGQEKAPLSRAATRSLNKARQLLGMSIGPTSPYAANPWAGAATVPPVTPTAPLNGLPPAGATSNYGAAARRQAMAQTFQQYGFRQAPPIPPPMAQASTGGTSPPSGPPVPPGGGGAGAGGAGRRGGGIGGLNIPSLPGTGLVQELGTEFAFAAKQVLLFGTAYKALAFLTGFPQQVGDAVGALQTFRNTLNTISPSAGEAAASSQFILDIVDKYNVPLQSARDGFTKLYASMQPAGFSGNEIRDLFLGISQSAATFGMSADKVDRVNYAFAQMASKGQVMSEELKGQLGDVLPGAMAIFTEAAGFKGPEAIKTFSKALEDGAYKGGAMKALLLNVGTIMRKEFGPGAEGAARTFQGSINRMQNSLKLLYESFEPVAIGFLNSVVMPMTAGIKTIADGFTSFFAGTKAKSAAGSAFAGELQKLKPALEGIRLNIVSLLPSIQELGKVLLGIGKVFLQIAGNPFVGFLGRTYLIALAATSAIRALNLLAIVPMIGNLLRAIPAFISFNALLIQGNSSALALKTTTFLLGTTSVQTAGKIRLIGTALSSLAMPVVLLGIGLIIERFMMLKGAIDGVQQSTKQMVANISNLANAGAAKEIINIGADTEKQIQTFESIREAIKNPKTLRGKAGKEIAKKMEEVGMGSFASTDVRGETYVPDYIAALKIVEEKLKSLRKTAASAAEKLPLAQKIQALEDRKNKPDKIVPIPPGEGKEGAAAAAAAKEIARLEAYRSLQDQLSKAASAADIARIQDEFEERFRLANSYYDLQEARANSFQKITINFQKELLAIEQRRQKAMLDAELDVRKARESVASEAMVSAGEAATGGIVARTGGAVNQNPLTRGSSTGPHLHAQAANVTENTLKYLVDKYLEIGGKAASSFGQSRGAAGHGYNAVDFLTPQDTPIKLKPGASISQYGPAGGRGGLMGQVTTPEGSFQLGHLTSLAASQGTAGAPGKILGSERRQTLATQQTGFALNDQRVVNLRAEKRATEETAIAIENYVAAIAPVAEQQLQNSILEKRVSLMKSGLSGNLLDTEIQIFEQEEKQRVGVSALNKMIEENNQRVEDGTMGKQDAIDRNKDLLDTINKLNIAVPLSTKLTKENAMAQANSAFTERVNALKEEIRLLLISNDAERRLAELRKDYNGDEIQAQRVFDLEKIKKNIEETRALIGDFVSSTTGDYKGFLKAVISGEDAADALKQFQEGLKDKVLTIFLDFAMAPVEKFLKEGLEGLLLPKAVKQKAGELPKEIAKDPVEATNRNTDVTALNTVALESVAAALAGASSTTGGVVGSPEEKTKNELDKMAKETGEAADEAKDNGEKFKESLGKVTAGIGIAAGSIMGIMAGMSQIKKGGTGNTLMGIGSILASVGGGIGGFMKLKGANGGTAAGGWKPFPARAFANGGMVKGPTLGLVGEGKYNEAIVPLPDGRSIPVQMRGGPGGGSSRDLLASQSQSRSSPSVLSMSFQSTTINGVEYVDRAQLEMAMAETRRVASRDGAARGANLAIDRLANSPSSRRRAGIR